ncbi:Methyltransferase-like protein 17, mitochondrial [Holothuria leucospilota]|uniref:Methyltransferase-like protein 17, mitochondrial n=1 Tax=Holothuria leucospilota TaxID=206669 RepID=A0A9Q1CBQ9_HOLLE|nr:Methyltransferase-like protein 17, mitochondrial [Holothuria leucospilota]
MSRLWKRERVSQFMKFAQRLAQLRCGHVVELDPSVAATLESSSPRRHPGIIQPKIIRLPESLQKNISNVYREQRIPNLQLQASALANYLKSRKRPVENSDVREAARYYTEKLGYTDTSKLDPEEEKKIATKVKNKLRKHLYHWKPISYDEKMCLVYLAARMAPNYAAIFRVLYEIKRRLPGFQPSSVLDFGSGLGSSVWAVNSLFQESVKEYYCVDVSQAMHNLAERLLWKPQHKGENADDLIIPGIYHRFFLPVSPKTTFDITISNNSLLEIQSHEERMKLLDILWNKTKDFLILIENGSLEGYYTLMEARNMILAKGQNEVSFNPEWCKGEEGYVFAPCSHDVICPRLVKDNFRPCNFEQKYEPLHIPGTKSQVKETERFSYLVLRKGSRPEGTVWPRVISEVLLRARHRVCRLCHTDGNLREVIVTKKKHEKNIYRCVRYTQWGDMLPVSRIESSSSEERKVREQSDDEMKDDSNEDGDTDVELRDEER